MKFLVTLIALTSMLTLFSASAEASQCRADLKNGRGGTLASFTGRGYDRRNACMDARRSCNRSLRNGHYRGRNLRCEVRQPRRRTVTRSCSAKMISRHGRRLDTFSAHATGRIGTGIQEQACRKAQRRCQMAKERRGRWGARCVVRR